MILVDWFLIGILGMLLLAVQAIVYMIEDNEILANTLLALFCIIDVSAILFLLLL